MSKIDPKTDGPILTSSSIGEKGLDPFARRETGTTSFEEQRQHLLRELKQRNAELAIINSVQAALAAELNIQGIYEAVGDKIGEIFGGSDIGIRIHDPQTNLVHLPYTSEGGERLFLDPPPFRGFNEHVLSTRETLVINENMAEELEKYGSFILPGSTMEKSAVYVPLIVGDQARGLIVLSNYEQNTPSAAQTFASCKPWPTA